MLNNLVIMGRLTKDPEIRQTANGVSVCRFGIANDRTTGENKITDFFDVVAWRKTAEFITNYFRKGDAIIITGRLETNEFTDRDGVQRKTVQIVVNSAEFGATKKAATNSPQNAPTQNNGNYAANNDMPFEF